MRNEFVPRCRLQIKRERRLSVYPDEIGPELDICHVTLWLRQKFRLPSAAVLLERHYTQIGREICGMIVVTAPKYSDRLTQAAEEAFLALSYDIEHTGADAYLLPSCNGKHSQHEVLQAYERIETAMQTSRVR